MTTNYVKSLYNEARAKEMALFSETLKRFSAARLKDLGDMAAFVWIDGMLCICRGAALDMRDDGGEEGYLIVDEGGMTVNKPASCADFGSLLPVIELMERQIYLHEREQEEEGGE